MMDNELPFIAALFRLLQREAGGSYGTFWLAELSSFDRDYATKTGGSNDEHLYPGPGGFVVDTPMGRYTGVTDTDPNI